MRQIESVNQRLRELDLGLAQRRIDRERYRFLRRALISEFEEQTAERGDATHPQTAPSVEGDRAMPSAAAAPAAPTVDSPSLAGQTSLRPSRIIGIGIGTILVSAAIAGGWWALAPKTETVDPATGADDGPVMPQDLVRRLMDSPWTELDLQAFLEDWQTLPVASLDAAQDDPRMWLLRQEINQRLRNAQEALALQDSERNQTRVRLLEQIQETIRP